MAFSVTTRRGPAGKGKEGAVGDPVEIALLVAGAKAGIDRKALTEHAPEEREIAFDPDVKMMATYHRVDDGLRVAVKGAPETVLTRCTTLGVDGESRALDEEAKQSWLARNDALASSGLRVLAVAQKLVDDSASEPYEELCLLGFVGLVDPPRTDVREAISQLSERRDSNRDANRRPAGHGSLRRP